MCPFPEPIGPRLNDFSCPFLLSIASPRVVPHRFYSPPSCSKMGVFHFPWRRQFTLGRRDRPPLIMAAHFFVRCRTGSLSATKRRVVGPLRLRSVPFPPFCAWPQETSSLLVFPFRVPPFWEGGLFWIALSKGSCLLLLEILPLFCEGARFLRFLTAYTSPVNFLQPNLFGAYASRLIV